MLASAESAAVFARGCAGKSTGHLLFATHPDNSEWLMPVAPPETLSTANLFIHRSNILYLAISHGPEKEPSSGSVVPGLCRILDMDFREYPFHALG
jgi:hypothetical protein